MQASDWTYRVQIGKNEMTIQRWSFSRRSIGYGLLYDWSKAANAKQSAAVAAIEQQIVMMTLGSEDRMATMAEVCQMLMGEDKLTPAESNDRYKALVKAVMDAEWKDWEATWPKPEGEQSGPPVESTENPT